MSGSGGGGGGGGGNGRLAAAQSLQNEHAEALLVQLNEFRKNEQYTDVCLICDDLRIKAHRNILAAASPYFQAMFGGNFPESSQSEVHIHDMEPRCLQLAVDFIYTGHLDNYVDCVQQLLETAAFLQLEHLMDLCTEYMCAQLDADNCLGFKHFAEKQNNFTLLDSACQYIITHFKEVVQSEEFLDMTFLELSNILANDALYVHSDDAVLCGLTRWAEHRPTERTAILAPLLRYIHPACVTADVARSLPILKQSVDSQSWLHDVLHSADSMEWHIFVLDKMGRKPDLQRFNMAFDEATQLQPLPRPAFAVSLTAHKNILYAQGGSVGRSTRESFYYNIYRDQWHELHPLLMERSHHRSVILNGCLYALGGNTLQGATCSVECLNLVTNKATFRENMLAKRNAMGAVVCDNTLYVMGGETDHRSLYSVERYDPRVGQWQEMPAMREVNSYCSSAAIGSHIYCCEGLGSCMERFDLRANRWDVINFWEEREFYEIFVVNNKLYSVSGEAIARYDDMENKWLCEFKFDESREWDTATGLQMGNYLRL
ncbi:kelch-like protein 2 [Bactrocera tryoni]|uniref:kelch-like protein 2 n=1 Tax=Bactrocera tryoni TaxID=59916 RepID=UPI001A96627E|nr:kelch-like protein 2 [Bactrocera tryoni]